jgi:hypothetical protein
MGSTYAQSRSSRELNSFRKIWHFFHARYSEIGEVLVIF